MNCDEAMRLIHGYLDAELDLVTSLEVERHMRDCDACAQTYENHVALRQAFQRSALYFDPPAALPTCLQSSLRRSFWTTERPARIFLAARKAAALAAALMLLCVLAWGLRQTFSSVSQKPFVNSQESAAGDALAQDVFASHIRSLMASHLEDVVSTDQHTVKPWFAGKLDFSPPVKDLAHQGFPLIGGRLDYLDNHSAAALVYKRHKHLINLFVWPAPPKSEEKTTTETRQGYHLVHWTQSGMTFWAVSDLNINELKQFSQILQLSE